MISSRAAVEPELQAHPVRKALLALIRRDGVVTATTAAAELGGSTGLYSFHLRQLARYGVIEEAPAPGGRVRPWRLAEAGAAASAEGNVAGASVAVSGAGAVARASVAKADVAVSGAGATSGAGAGRVSDAELSVVARGLEDESYQHWLEHRADAPERWRHDEAFSQVVYVTPEEMAGLADVIRAAIAQYRYREGHPAERPPSAAPVAVVARLFPLLASGPAPSQQALCVLF